MPNIARIERTTRYFVALIATLALLSAIATAALARGQDLGHSIVLKGPISNLFDEALPTTARNLVVGVALSLPLGLIFGVMAGLRPRSLLARLVETPAILLVPAVVYPIGLAALLIRNKYGDYVDIVNLHLAVGMIPWATRAVVHGLMKAKSDGRFRPLRAVTGFLGCLLQEIGPFLAAVFMAELAWSNSGLFDLMRRAIQRGDYAFIIWGLATVLLGAQVLHLAGELLASSPRQEAPNRRLSPALLSLGCLFTLCLPVAALLSFQPTAVTQSAISHGREWAALALATRQSLVLALGALAVAMVTGLLMGGIARNAGERGQAILSPAVQPSNLLRSLMGGLGGLFLLGARPTALAVGVGLVSAPAMAFAVRRWMASPRSGAWRTVAATTCFILGEAIMVELGLRYLLGIAMVGVSGLSQLNMLMHMEVILQPKMAVVQLLPLAGIAGLFLLGHALTEPDR